METACTDQVATELSRAAAGGVMHSEGSYVRTVINVVRSLCASLKRRVRDRRKVARIAAALSTLAEVRDQ